jgi:uncharacterized integral membrane protein (TIGR00698 family)
MTFLSSASPSTDAAPSASLLARAGRNPALILVPLGAVLALLPLHFVSPGVALLAGALLGMTLGNPYLSYTRSWAKKLLSIAVVGLGAGMDLRVVARAGLDGLATTAISITACLALGALLTKVLRIPLKIGALVTVGTAICGGSAIAAIAPVLRADEEEAGVALGTVFVLNAVALFAFPAFGFWAALAIHDTSSVVGAGQAYGATALQVATTVKLARALWIVPLTFAVGAWAKRRLHTGTTGTTQRAQPPWFIAGFLVAAALTTYVEVLHGAGLVTSRVAAHLLSATLFLIGAGITRASLAKVGARPLLHGVLLWMVVASLSLVAVLRGVVG